MTINADLTYLQTLCERFDQPLAIRGSTAYMLCRPEADWRASQGSLVGSVPPLGDLDLVVRNDQPADAMPRVAAILENWRSDVPASRFIHVDVFYDQMPARSDSPLGNVNITNMPEVHIGDRRNNDWKIGRDGAVDPAKGLHAHVDLRTTTSLFRDYLYLLRLNRRQSGLKDAIEEVAGLLRSQRPNVIGAATRTHGGARELARIDKALVKHVLLRGTDGTPTGLSDLGAEWLSRFSAHLNGLSRRIILSQERWNNANAIAYAVEGRIVEFAELPPDDMDVPSIDPEENALMQKKLAPGAELAALRLTPSLKVALQTPPDPDCCRYRDFSTGISELAFRDPHGTPLGDLVLMEGRERYYPVHAQAAEGCKARSLRTDPGYMAMLNGGSMNAVRLVGVRK